MELELDPRHKILPFKVRAASKESQPQKAAHVLDTDLRNHWSTSTNTKEWLLLELEEPCLLHQIRIHNKSVLEWEISVGLRYKQPDTFLKVRPRCEAPRRDVQYLTGYAPCRYVRISCLRGNPIAIFFIQLIGINMPGLEPEFQPVVDHLLPQITSHKQDSQDLHLQLLRDITMRLSPFLPHLEGELPVNSEAMESNIRFLAMLAGPFHPILMVVDGRERTKNASSVIDLEPLKSSQASVFTVSSNFQAPPRRSRSPVPSQQPVGHMLAFRPDVVLLLLKVAYKDSTLGVVCRMVARLLRKIAGPVSSVEPIAAANELATTSSGQVQVVFGSEDMGTNIETTMPASQTDYSSLFGEEFRVLDDDGGELGFSAFVDVAAVEEGLLHFLYACASQPLLCRRLSDVKPDLSPVLPFIQAMLPALRPAPSSSASADQFDESFSVWQAPLVQRALTQVVSVSTSQSYRPLLDACAGYLSSFSPAHEKAACVIIDLCSGPLAPWLPMVIAKVDLAFELVEELLGIIQVVHQGTARARAALVYLMLGLSGHMDDVLTQYKDVKHNLIFLIEMLEPFLMPAITPVKNTIAFGDVSAVLSEKQERTCALALDLLRTAIKKPAVLPALESEWRRGHVMPSVLLSILAPHVPLPPGIDLRKSVAEKGSENESSAVKQAAVENNVTMLNPGISKNMKVEEEVTVKPDSLAADVIEDPNLLFVPAELKLITWQSFSNPFEGTPSDGQGFGQFGLKVESKLGGDTKDNLSMETLVLDRNNAEQFFNLQAEYLQLVNHQERELRASEFIRFAAELHSRVDANWESHHAAIDALLLAAECHLNPFFMIHSIEYQHLLNRVKNGKGGSSTIETKYNRGKASRKDSGVALVSCLEEERDKAVLHILLKAAEWDSEALRNAYEQRFIIEEPLSSECEDRAGGIFMSCEDTPMEDATTLVRKHQSLLCKFLVHQLQRERHNMYEVLMQGLLFLLYSATQLSCPPERIVDVIMKSAERLNTSLVSVHNQLKEGNTNVGSAIVHGIRRQWALLGRLVVAASGGGSLEDDKDTNFTGFVYYRDLVPASAWMARIAQFSSSIFPLVRYVGWKGLSRFAKFQQDTGLLLASDMHQLSSLLSIFADELTSSAILAAKSTGCDELQLQVAFKSGSENSPGQSNAVLSDQCDLTDPGGLVNVLYPELDLVSPNLRNQFSLFADAMLEAVCLQLRIIPPSAVPDVLSWFSELCCCPFSDAHLERKQNLPVSGTGVKGFAATNVRFVILRLLEVILGEHMEAILPELPRVLVVILSLCQSSYCDVPLLDSVLMTLKPIISYAVASAAASEYQLEDDPAALTFEALCFDSMMDQLRIGPDMTDETTGQGSKGALLLFFSGFVLSDLSALRRKELMHLLMRWVKFTSFSPTGSYHNYLCAFQKIIVACESLVQEALDERGLSSEKGAGSSKDLAEDATTADEISELSYLPHASTGPGAELLDPNPQGLEELQVEESNLEYVRHTFSEARSSILPGHEATSSDGEYDMLIKQSKPSLFPTRSELEEFAKCLQELVFALGCSLETVWKLHGHLAEKLTKKSAHCLMTTNFLLKNYVRVAVPTVGNGGVVEISRFALQGKQAPVIWEAALEAVAQSVMTFQHDDCWQVAASTMDFLLSLPTSLNFSEILPSICLALQYQCNHAPRVSWRQWVSKWLSKVLTRIAPDQPNFSSAPLTQLLGTMLEHKEPEQRAGALQQLEKLVELEELGRSTLAGSSIVNQGISEKSQTWHQCREKLSNIEFVSAIVAATWDKVLSLAACDASLRLRRQAMELLLRLIPLAQLHQLHTFLSSVDAILPGLTQSVYTMKDAPLTRLALALLARACLYSSLADVDTISPSVWTSLEILSKARPGSIFVEAERAVCVALLQLREHGEDAKQSIQEALLRQTETRQPSPQFAAVRETVLEVLARLNSVRLKGDAYTAAALQEEKELEEAEIELELSKQEQALQERTGVEGLQASLASNSLASCSGSPSKNTKQRLEELRAQILAEERSATRAEIVARRERQRIARRDRQLALEEATLREIELLQDLDREKAAEAEREIERHRMLERERVKTRELRHNLDLEAEKRAQRDLQRELEQRESGVIRSARREFSSSTTSSRPRERYRERENGRPSQDSRPSSSGGTGRENGTTPPATPTAGATNISSATSSLPSVVIATSTINSRAYPGQSLSFSQSRDRIDDRGYEENLDGVGIARDSGEGSNYGDMEAGMIDPGSSGSQRQGSRTSRPRQIVERRERDSRREGKWERKQT